MFISVGNAKIYATAYGATTNPAILGIGGWIGSSELWAEPFSLLSQSFYTIAYDHRGSGATDAPIELIALDQLTNDVFAVLDAYRVETCILAAESAGALTAFCAALKQPQRIKGLVIVDGMVFRSTPPEKDQFLFGLRHAYPTTLDRFVEACVPEPDSDHIKRWGRQILDRASPEAAIALYLIASVDLRPEVSRITQPTLVLHGESDVSVPLSEAQWLVSTLPNSTLKVFQGAGHVPTLTRPQEVADAIMNFFGHQASP